MKTNASDERKKAELKEFASRIMTNSFVKTLYLLDEVDGLKNQAFLTDILKKAKKPVILTANYKHKLSPALKRACKIIEFNKPALGSIVKRLKYIEQKEGIKGDFSKITPDIRSSINNVFNNGKGYKEEKNEFDKVDDIFKGKKTHDIHPIWLIDNITNYLNGKDIIDAVRTIKAYEIIKKPEVLSCIPTCQYGRPRYPNYFRRKKHGHT